MVFSFGGQTPTAASKRTSNVYVFADGEHAVPEWQEHYLYLWYGKDTSGDNPYVDEDERSRKHRLYAEEAGEAMEEQPLVSTNVDDPLTESITFREFQGRVNRELVRGAVLQEVQQKIPGGIPGLNRRETG